MSFNDRCHEALFALRSGVPIDDTPELRAALDEMLVQGAQGHRFPERGLVISIRDRGLIAGIDLDKHECPAEFTDEYGDHTCRRCSDLSLEELPSGDAI